MKIFKRILAIAGIVLASVIKLILIGFFAVFLFFDSVAPLVITPLGEYISPDKKHVCIVYVTDGGATTPFTVIGQIRGTWIIGSRTVYSVDNIEEATVRWVNNRTVRINGVKLDIYKDQYVGDIYDLKGG
jgi:hypothetical protein